MLVALLVAGLIFASWERTPAGSAGGNAPVQRGLASWYGPGFHGEPTAQGELFDMHALTAAHRSLPMGTRVRVTNLENGKSVVVRINDRGPYKRGVIIDLSRRAAGQIGMIRDGRVRVEVATVRS
jgi:rare lipoprotein A